MKFSRSTRIVPLAAVAVMALLYQFVSAADREDSIKPEAAESSAGDPLAQSLQASMESVTPSDPFQRDPGRVTFATCMPCHGSQGEGNRAVYAPPLAGQRIWYLERQLKLFREGVRGGHPNDVHGAVMQAMARLVENTDSQQAIIEDIETFSAHAPEPTVQGDINAGREIYESLCQRCHDAQGEGNAESGAPRLNVLPDWYIIRQLQNFQAGFRGEHEGDEFGEDMRPMALSVMEVEELKNVAAYVQTLEQAPTGPDTETDSRRSNRRNASMRRD